MNSSTKIIIFSTICIILFLVVYKYSKDEIYYVKSDVDNNVYAIRRGTKPEEFLKASANTLAEINKRIIILITHLDTKYKDYNDYYYFIKMLKNNYSYKILSEAAIDRRYTTFTIDKSDMHICLRTRDKKDDLYDINLLMYVVLHELAHLCNYTRTGMPINGHGTEFKKIFKLLVSEAMSINVYSYDDYTSRPQEYCGIILNSNIV